MIRVTMSGRNEVYILENEKIVKFDGFGEVIDENVPRTPTVTNAMQNLPIFSVLSSGGQVDTAIFENDTMKRYSCGMSASDIVSSLMTLKGFARMLKRTGMSDGIKFNQMIYIFPMGYNFNTLIATLGLQIAE